jgi:hypothetical protein
VNFHSEGKEKWCVFDGTVEPGVVTKHQWDKYSFQSRVELSTNEVKYLAMVLFATLA